MQDDIVGKALVGEFHDGRRAARLHQGALCQRRVMRVLEARSLQKSSAAVSFGQPQTQGRLDGLFIALLHLGKLLGRNDIFQDRVAFSIVGVHLLCTNHKPPS